MKTRMLPSSLLAHGPQELEDISGQRRSIRGRFTPKTVEQVQQIVRWAAEVPGTKLQPISCGNNWGFGSHLPSEDNCYLLDLSGLASIRRLATEENYVELEPGVTQGVLDSALAIKGRTHYYNVTGAGSNASVLGNALERGIGYFGLRHEDILDLEVILPNGDLVYTGIHPDNPFHSGLGPNLGSLFIQSSLGIVTAARVRLHKRPPCMGALLIKPHCTTRIVELVSILNELVAEGILRGVPHIGNRERAYATFGPYLPADNREQMKTSLPEWTAVAPIFGSQESVIAISDHIRSRINKFASCDLITTRETGAPPWTDSLLDLCQGIPSNIALPGVAFAALGETEAESSQPEKGIAGLIHVVPACRPQPDELQHLLDLISETKKLHDIAELPMTINLANLGMAVVVISVPFCRVLENAKMKAMDFARELKKQCFEQGFFPYRFGLGDGELLPANNCWKSNVLEILHQSLDQQEILCRSKYAPPRQTSASRERRGLTIGAARQVDLEEMAV